MIIPKRTALWSRDAIIIVVSALLLSYPLIVYRDDVHFVRDAIRSVKEIFLGPMYNTNI